MFGWLKDLFGAPQPKTMTQREVKRLICADMDMVDNPAMLRVTRAIFELPTEAQVFEAMRDLPMPTYSEKRNCTYFCRRLASHLGGHGWPVGLITIDKQGNIEHQIVLVVTDSGLLWLEAQTKRRYIGQIEIIYGEIA